MAFTILSDSQPLPYAIAPVTPAEAGVPVEARASPLVDTRLCGHDGVGVAQSLSTPV